MTALTPEQLEKVEAIFEGALECDPLERDGFLDSACGGDVVLRDAIDSLIQSYERAGMFLETPVIEQVFIQSEARPVPACIAHYEIIREIGRGGMGQVFLAHDTRLERPVALKMLPYQFTKNADQVKRFEREARAASALNHPNIITIHDIVQEGDAHFIATEFIQGHTLRQKLANGKLPLNETLDIAIQISKALMAAHAARIIHRDVKPENIMMRDDGLVKVLDFGLAKPIEGESSSSYAAAVNDLKTSPENFMGTVGYMSPEQVLRESVDHRTDIFSVGVVMYEMVSGERPFKGTSSADVFDAVLNLDAAPLQMENGRLNDVIERALKKDRELRYQTAAELLIDLTQVTQEWDSAKNSIAERSANSSKVSFAKFRIAWVLSGLVLVAICVYLAANLNRKQDPSTQPAIIASARPLSQSQALEYYPSFSPDGQSVIFESFDSNTSDIYLQRVDARVAVNLTEDFAHDASEPAFSPDGHRIAFSSSGIWTMSSKGGDYVKLSDEGFNPSWSPDGREIVYATDRTIDSDRSNIPSQLWVLNVETRDKRLLTEGDATQPNWSPHGQRIAYWNAQRGGQRDIWTVDANGKGAVAVTDDEFEDWGPVWSPDGRHLYFISNRGGSMNLWRIAIDEQTGKVSGQPEPVTAPAVFCWHICFSRDGKRIAYVQVSRKGNLNRLTLDPVNARAIGEPVSITQGSSFATEPAILSDSRSLIYNSIGEKQEDLFVLNVADGQRETENVENNRARRLTDDTFKDRSPRGSPDGNRIAFYSDRGGDYQIWLINKDGSGLEQLTFEKGGNVFCPVWSPDSSRIAYCFKSAETTDTFILNANQKWTDQTPQAVPQDGSLVRQFLPSSWSGDGLKLAGWQQWTERGRAGVFVYSFASHSYERWTDFGSFPVWLSDGRRLLFFEGHKIYLVDEVTKKPKLIHEVNSIAWTDLTGITLTKDDRYLYFSQGTTEADIWLAEIR